MRDRDVSTKQKIIILAALQLIGMNAKFKTIQLPTPQFFSQSCEVTHNAA